MKSSITSVRLLPSTVRTFLFSEVSQSEVCRVAICALHLTREKDAPLPPPEEVAGAAWTTVSLDLPSTLLFQHLTTTAGYRNLSVIMAAATYGKETCALTKEILELSSEERREFIRSTVVQSGLLPEDAVLPVPKEAVAREEKRLREAQIGVLKFLAKFGKNLSVNAKTTLEREASALHERLALLQTTTS